MTRRLPLLVTVALLLATSISGAQEPSAPDPGWQISQVRGGVYRVNAGTQVTVFFVTGDGIVLVDSLSRSVSAWLKQELANRFPKEPVRYVVYTHHHFDRASGGGAFDETAEHVAHETFSKERARSAETLPAALATLDSNRNGRLDRDELSGTTSASLLSIYDHNEDRSITPGELYSFVRSPESTYRMRRTLIVNGKSVELIYTRSSHAVDMTAVYFPDERIMFAVDLVSVRAMPLSIGPDPRSTISSMQRLEGLAFDTLITGNGEEGTQADIGVFRNYLQELTTGVRARFNAGLSVDETKRTVRLEKFSTLSGFTMLREANIAEVYASLRPVLTNVYGAMHVVLQQVELDGCQPRLYDSCVSSPSFPSFGGAVGLNVSLERLTIGGEISSSQPMTARQLVTDSFFDPYELVLQYRDTMATFLAGYRLGDGNGVLVDVQGGLSLVTTRSRLTMFAPRVSGGDAAETHTEFGPSVGATIMAPIGAKYSIVVPVRLTTASRGRLEMGGMSFTAGAGLMVNVARSSR